MNTPYLSIVTAGRNDNYGEDYLSRFQIFLDSQFEVWRSYQTPVELIIVEWNPPVNTERFAAALDWSRKPLHMTARIVEVPASLHHTVNPASNQPFFEYLGKNVGVRRARGEYVLVTNTDLIYTPELIGFFAARRLESGRVYRADRYDVARGVIRPGLALDRMIQLCHEHYTGAHNNYGASFLRGEKPLGPRNLRRALTIFKNAASYFPGSPPYMNAAGDFFLMSRAKWLELRGYPELPPFAYPDALCFMALSSGLKQTVLRYPRIIYHQEHARGGPETGRPISDFESHKQKYRSMLRQKTPWIPNPTVWGFGDAALPETIV